MENNGVMYEEEYNKIKKMTDEEVDIACANEIIVERNCGYVTLRSDDFGIVYNFRPTKIFEHAMAVMEIFEDKDNWFSFSLNNYCDAIGEVLGAHLKSVTGTHGEYLTTRSIDIPSMLKISIRKRAEAGLLVVYMDKATGRSRAR